MTNLQKHLRTIRKHRKYVRQMCFKMGLFWQGLTHDLSKYSLKELSIAKYYGGTKSPHAVCREQLGYSPSWQYHYHKNKHHWQYWLDIEDWPDKVAAVKMPYKYVIEMFCDFIGAGKAYNDTKWNENMPLDYYEKSCKGKRLMHSASEDLLVLLLTKIKELKMKEFMKWYKKNKKILKNTYMNKINKENNMETLREFLKKHFKDCGEGELYIMTSTMGCWFEIEDLKKNHYMLKQYVAEWSYQNSAFHIFLKENK